MNAKEVKCIYYDFEWLLVLLKLIINRMLARNFKKIVINIPRDIYTLCSS